MDQNALPAAIGGVPAGGWAVGVSGGADSVALLLLLAERADLTLQVVHLDHETRDGQSAVDAQFVADLSAQLGLPCTVQLRSAIEASLPAIATNQSSRFRLARLALFHQVVAAESLQGVLLAHHADDQAETVLMRILRGARLANLHGMQPMSVVGGLTICRPLLGVAGADLREFLQQRGQAWREDSSNQSDKYQRNRIRRWLANQPALREALLRLGRQSASLRQWLDQAAPRLEAKFPVTALSSLPQPLAQHAAARWLLERGSPPMEISLQTCDRLVEMASDAATPARRHFPGELLVRRKQGMMFVD